MNIFETLILNTVLTIFPLMLYLFYVAKQKNISQKVSLLFFDLSLLTSLYLILKFGKSPIYDYSIITFNVVLLISFLKKRIYLSTIISTFIIYNYFINFDFNIYLLMIEYFFLFVLFTFKKENKYDSLIFTLIIPIFIVINLLQNNVLSVTLTETMISTFIFIIIVIVSDILLKIGEEIIKYHMTIKELEQEKQVRTSLFKISHEIKNPIAVCKGYLDMFDKNNLDHSKKYIPIVQDEIDRVLLLLEDFLSFTRVKINKNIMDINFLLEELFNNFIPIFKEKNINYKLDIKDEELYINADYSRLMQVFINVIKNSIEAIKDNGFITVSSIKHNNNVEIIVKDNGCGISEENLKQIKQPFFTTKPKGTGLGISFSNEIIASHEGTIEYNSKLKKGTTVKIVLPINQNELMLKNKKRTKF